MKQVLVYSIQPEYIAQIANGLKTIEVRKRDLPQWAKDKLARGEKVIGYGYCTMGKPFLINHPYHSYMLVNDNSLDILNGFVVVKFEVSGVTKLDVSYSMWTNAPMENEKIILKSCLTAQQIEKYSWDGGTYKDLYAHHITNIQPIEPMELGEFRKPFYSTEDVYGEKTLTKAPQSFMTCWVKNNEKGEKS